MKCNSFGNTGCPPTPCKGYETTEASESTLIALLSAIGANKEVVMFGTPAKQYDATEPRYELKIIGPERLVLKLMNVIHGG